MNQEKNNTQKITKCPKCSQLSIMTKDHIVPVWFIKLFRYLEIKNDISKKLIKKSNIQKICPQCNLSKGHKVDFNDPQTRELIFEVIKALDDKLKNPPDNIDLYNKRNKRVFKKSASNLNKEFKKENEKYK